jgi:hypothetical protein
LRHDPVAMFKLLTLHVSLGPYSCHQRPRLRQERR